MPITIPIEIGDVIRTGKFKNKRVTVKEIGTDEYGLPTCNGKGIMKIRIEKLMPPKEPKTENKMNEKFKEGDKVKCLKGQNKNMIGTVTYVAGPSVEVNFPDRAKKGKNSITIEMDRDLELLKENKAKLDKMIFEALHSNDTQIKIKQKDKLWWIHQEETDECLNAVGFETKEQAEHSALTKGYSFSGQEEMNEIEPEVLTTKKEKVKGVDKVEDMKLDKEKEIKLEILRIVKKVIKEEISQKTKFYGASFDPKHPDDIFNLRSIDAINNKEALWQYAKRGFSNEENNIKQIGNNTWSYRDKSIIYIITSNENISAKKLIPAIKLKYKLGESFNKKKELTELEVTDPQIAAEMEDMAKIANEMDRLQNEMDKLKDKYKPLEQKMLQLMEEAQKTGDRAVETQKVLITIKRQGYEADSVAWKEFYKEFYPKINKRMREQADELLAAHTKVKKVASSLAVQYKGEGLMKEENIFSKLFNKAKDYINNVLNSLKNRGREIDLLLNKTKSIR